jgi:hypothetical protein
MRSGGQSQDRRAEGLGSVAAAVDRQARVAGERDGIADDLRAARARAGAAREVDRAVWNVDGAAEILGRAAVELECGADGHVAVAKDHDAPGRPGRGSRQIDGGTSIDRRTRPAAAALFGEDERHASAMYRGIDVGAETSAIDVIDAWIERNVRLGVERHAPAVKPGSIVTVDFAEKSFCVHPEKFGNESSA